MTLDEAIAHAEEVAADCENDKEGICELLKEYPERRDAFANDLKDYNSCAAEHRQLAEWLRELQERRKQPGELIRCKDCIYYDPPHVENNGVRYEYAEMPKEAFDILGTGLVNVGYGINVGGRCTRDYNTGYSDDKRVYVPENNFCGRAERRTE